MAFVPVMKDAYRQSVDVSIICCQHRDARWLRALHSADAVDGRSQTERDLQ
jgi:hypothetical protein